MPAINDTIDELYRVFAGYRCGPQVEGCPCCVDPVESCRLASTPLRSLTSQDLDRYARKAITTWGTVADLKHFLPRLLELAYESPDDFELEVLFGKLELACWEEWSSIEVSAVRDYLSVFWISALSNTDVNDYQIDTLLCAIGGSVSDITPWLRVWTSLHDLSAIEHLGQFVALNVPNLIKKQKLWNSFWNGHAGQQDQVTAWLSERQTLNYLESGILIDGASDELANAADMLNWYHPEQTNVSFVVVITITPTPHNIDAPEIRRTQPRPDREHQRAARPS